MNSRISSAIVGLAGLLAVLLHCANAEAAEKLLRWKFRPEQSLRVRCEQTTHTETTVAGKPTNISIEMLMEMTWRVDQVSAEGTANLTQTLDRFAVNMKTAAGPPIEYDSIAGVAASGPAREIAASIAPLIGTKLLVTMNQRGEVTAVEVPEGQGPQQGPASRSAAASLFSPAGISQVLRQSAVLLPAEPLDEGAQWTAEYSLDSPLGKLQQLSSYTYAGTAQHDGKPRERIDVETKVELVQPPQSERSGGTTIKEQKHSGVLWFDFEAGRFVQSELNQSLLLERPYRELRILVRTNTTTKMTIRE